MAKDDMIVIMYKILKYLYECMKNGREAELEDFAWECRLFSIPLNDTPKMVYCSTKKAG